MKLKDLIGKVLMYKNKIIVVVYVEDEEVIWVVKLVVEYLFVCFLLVGDSKKLNDLILFI